MANKKADFKLTEDKEDSSVEDTIKLYAKQTAVRKCWYDEEEKQFHCIMNNGSEWTSATGRGDDWHRAPTVELSDDYKHSHFREALDYALKEKVFVKADSGKLQWSLLPFEELKDVVKVLMLGAKKYSPDNWKKCDDVTRYKDALMRHVISYIIGDKADDESGLSHLAHAVCNCLFLMYFENTKKKE